MIPAQTRHGFRQRLASALPAAVRDLARVPIRASRRVGYARSRWHRPLGTKPATGLAVCGIFCDEAPYLAEWVTFHRMMGVERFYLYDNSSVDDWRDVLAPELAKGIVMATSWPQRPGQLSAYSDCLSRHRSDTRWVAFIDIDEFLFSPVADSLVEVLGEFTDVPAVAVNWRVYGTSGWEQQPAGLVVESYTMRASDHHPLNRHVKSIVYPRKTSARVLNPHAFLHFGSPVGEDHRPTMTAFRDPPTADLLRINHYVSKSSAEWRVKLTRPRSDMGMRRMDEPPPPDEQRDDALARFVPALRTALATR